MKWMFKLLIMAAILWSGYWFVGAKAQKELFATLLSNSRNTGWTAESQTLGVQGFPNRFDTTLTHLDIQDPTGQWGWQAEAFQIKALSYSPDHVILAWPGAQVFNTPAGRLTLNAQLLRASLVLTPTPDLPLSRLQLEGAGLHLEAGAGWLAEIATLNAALFQNDSTKTRYHLGIDATGITPPARFTSRLGGGGNLPALISHLHIAAQVDFDREINRLAFSTGQPPLPTGAEIEPSRIIWGGSTLEVSGRLTANPAGYLDGILQLKAHNWQPLFAVFLRASQLGITEKLTLKRALDAASSTGELALTLTFANGETRIGPVRIGPAPAYP